MHVDHMCSLECIQVLCPFLNHICFLLSFRISVYILEINFLSEIRFANSFPILWAAFFFLLVPLMHRICRHHSFELAVSWQISHSVALHRKWFLKGTFRKNIRVQHGWSRMYVVVCLTLSWITPIFLASRLV